MPARALNGTKLLRRFRLLLRLRAGSCLSSKRCLVGVLASYGFTLLNLHYLLDYAVLHEVVDLGLIYSFPVFDEFLKGLLKILLKMIEVLDLVVGMSP